jgi:inner membrane protein
VDVFTHALLGVAAVQATALGRPHLSARERLLLGGLAAAFPDADFAAFPIDPLRFLADWHQGPTHSAVLLPLWAGLIGGAFVLAAGRRRAFAQAAFVSGLGLASHIAGDAITAYGTAVLYPLSELRVGLGITFVIDPLFTGIVLAGLVASLAAGRPWIGAAGFAVLGLYVTGQALLQQRALELARTSTQAVSFQRVDAFAQPFSPFNWKLIGVDGPRYHVAYVNLAGHRPALPLPRRLADVASAYRAPAQLAWSVRHRYGERPEQHGLVEERWTDPRFAPYRRFATHPAVSRIDEDGVSCVWFTDLRYDLPVLPDTFRYGFCREGAERAWQPYRLRYFSERSRQRLTPGQ